MKIFRRKYQTQETSKVLKKYFLLIVNLLLFIFAVPPLSKRNLGIRAKTSMLLKRIKCPVSIWTVAV